MGLSEALELAEPGDTIFLADGTYDTAIVSYRDGKEGQPITIQGGNDVVIKGNYRSRSVLINHSFISLKHFTVEGKIEDSSDAGAYNNKCVYVDGEGSELDGFVMEGLLIQNCGGECVRLKNSVVNSKILDNTIENCGIHDYKFESEDKNGEGIYVGTSSNQWVDETSDNCFGNVIEGNIISTNGNECVEIKEGSKENIVEMNVCSNQLDKNSGCYGVRGDDNIIRHGDFRRNKACFRVSEFAPGCILYCSSVYGNDFYNCGEGSIKVVTENQGLICGNTCDEGNCELYGSVIFYIPDTWDQACG
ncbi:unnamed protein product, partial [Ascophyllum nodosum]